MYLTNDIKFLKKLIRPEAQGSTEFILVLIIIPVLQIAR